jgi:hypothetical protein
MSMTTDRKAETPPRTPDDSADAPEKQRGEWVTGHEHMTKAQASYLKTLAAETGETFDSGLSKAEASKRIEELQRKIARAQSNVEGGDGGTSIRANEAAPSRPGE